MGGRSPRSTQLRSRSWFNDQDDPGATAIYLERYLNFGLTRQELQSERPIVGIAQSGSDLAPCNRHHLELANRLREGIRDAGGIPLEFPVHPIQETGRRPTAALDRNLATLGLIELLHGYPLDAVILTTGCDKTTPSQLMAAASVDLPTIVSSGGPMLDGHYQGRCVAAGTIIWEARKRLARGEIDYEAFMDMAASSSPSIGHCNGMGTALTMNCLAEGLGMSLPGCATIPAAYRERGQMSYATGKRIVEMVHEDLTPSKILHRQAFLNAIVLCAALGGSTNAVPHLLAIARHAQTELALKDWQQGHDVPLLVNCQPAGTYLGEAFHRAGGVPAVMRELLSAGLIDGTLPTVSGATIAENVRSKKTSNCEVIHPLNEPLMPRAGFLVLTGNFFSSAILKTSAISSKFRERYLCNPRDPEAFEATAVVFEGPEDYRARINSPELAVDEHSLLVMRGAGVVGYPGSAEVINMQPPDRLLRAGVDELPTMGDGRQSGTSGSPSILHVCPESALGEGFSRLRTGDRLRVDLRRKRVDILEDLACFRARPPVVPSHLGGTQTPWQALARRDVSQLDEGAVLKEATAFARIRQHKPRHSH